jgi:hypothetical protein
LNYLEEDYVQEKVYDKEPSAVEQSPEKQPTIDPVDEEHADKVDELEEKDVLASPYQDKSKSATPEMSQLQ